MQAERPLCLLLPCPLDLRVDVETETDPASRNTVSHPVAHRVARHHRFVTIMLVEVGMYVVQFLRLPQEPRL